MSYETGYLINNLIYYIFLYNKIYTLNYQNMPFKSKKKSVKPKK